MQMIMMVGILSYADFSLETDRMLIIIYTIAQIMFIIGTEFSRKIFCIKPHKIQIEPRELLTSIQKNRIWLMIIVSILACVYLFYKAGNNVFIMIIKSLLSGSTTNITDNRLYNNSVVGVGYIYQFRVIILPMLTAYLVTAGIGVQKKVAYAIFPLMLVFILGTGQRGGFVMFALIWITAMILISKNYNTKLPKKIIVISFLFLAIFALLTVFNGRTEKTGSISSAIAARILGDNQQCAVIGFRYIYTQPIQLGKDLLLSLSDILPGKNEYLQLSYIIFGIMYGTTRGTAPPCIWGSVYYNWGIFGIIVFPLIMGIAYHYIYYRLYRRPLTKLRIIIYSGMFITLGMWIADTPLVLFNQGFVTICCMAYVLHIDRTKKLKE